MQRLRNNSNFLKVDGVSHALLRLYRTEPHSDDPILSRIFSEMETLLRDMKMESKKPLIALINDRLAPYLTALAQNDSATYGEFERKTDEVIARENGGRGTKQIKTQGT